MDTDPVTPIGTDPDPWPVTPIGTELVTPIEMDPDPWSVTPLGIAYLSMSAGWSSVST
jgi:hypothetical protein